MTAGLGVSRGLSVLDCIAPDGLVSGMSEMAPRTLEDLGKSSCFCSRGNLSVMTAGGSGASRGLSVLDCIVPSRLVSGMSETEVRFCDRDFLCKVAFVERARRGSGGFLAQGDGLGHRRGGLLYGTAASETSVTRGWDRGGALIMAADVYRDVWRERPCFPCRARVQRRLIRRSPRRYAA